jgi:hypothetical protein
MEPVLSPSAEYTLSVSNVLRINSVEGLVSGSRKVANVTKERTSITKRPRDEFRVTVLVMIL